MGAPICPLSGNSALTIRQVLPAALSPEIEHICIAREPSVPVPARQREVREKRKTEKGRKRAKKKAENGVISRQGRESSGSKDRGQGRKNIMPCGEKRRQGRKKEKRKMTRLGVVGIVIERPCKEVAGRVQALLSDFADIITGRMGVPDKESGVNAIAVIVKGSVERISALSGKLGKLEGVCIKTALTSAELPE